MKHLILFATVFGFSAGCAGRPAPTTTPDIELAAHRTQMLTWLADYTERGEFPTDDKGLPLSVFKDSHGVRCPMAELIYRSGHADLVDAIAAEDNHARLADVHDGPINDWMVSSGLTHDEIAMIQGAAEIDYTRFKVNVENQVITAQRERVRGRLEMAQSALKKDTKDSLVQAVIALPQHHVPEVKLARPVLAKH